MCGKQVLMSSRDFKNAPHAQGDDRMWICIFVKTYRAEITTAFTRYTAMTYISTIRPSKKNKNKTKKKRKFGELPSILLSAGSSRLARRPCFELLWTNIFSEIAKT